MFRSRSSASLSFSVGPRLEPAGRTVTEQEVDKLIARDDLVACLDRAAARKVTIISAPAGSGKTSLLRAWANRPGRAHRVAFVPVRRGEQDAQAVLADPAQRRPPSPADATSDTEPPTATPDFSPRTLADRVLSELADLSDRVIMVIDDLHELNSPDALAQLTRLLTNLPPNGHAILATRHDLPAGPAPAAPGGRAGRDPRGGSALSPNARHASCSTPRVSRCPRPGRRCCTSGQKGGPRACGWRRCPWPVTPTRSGSSRSSPAATARSRSTWSPRCWNASPTTSRTCCCAPACSTGSTASWPTC